MSHQLEQFKQDFLNADSDHDGYLTQDQFHQMFKKYDPEFYIGTAGTVIDQLDFADKNPGKLGVEPASEYFLAFQNRTGYLLEAKYFWLKQVKSIKMKIAKLREENSAPTASPMEDFHEIKPQESKLKIKVGNNVGYPNKVQVKVRKSQSAAQDNFVRLDIKADSVDKADKLVESVRNFYKGFIDELLGELPEAAYVVDRLQFDVKKENDWVQLLLRSNCQELNEVIGLIVSSVDQLSDAPTELSGHLRLQTGFSFKQLLESNMNIYGIFFRDLQLQLNLTTNKQVMQALKKLAQLLFDSGQLVTCLKKADFLNPDFLFYSFCCNSGFKADLQFQNTVSLPMSEQQQQYQAALRAQVLMGPAQLHGMLREHYPFGGTLLEDLFNNAEGSIEVTGVFSKVWLNAKLRLGELGYVYKKITEVTLENHDDTEDCAEGGEQSSFC